MRVGACVIFVLAAFGNLWSQSDRWVGLLITRDVSRGLVSEAELRSEIKDPDVLVVALSHLRKEGLELEQGDAKQLSLFHGELYDLIEDQARGRQGDGFQPRLTLGVLHEARVRSLPYGEWADSGERSGGQFLDLGVGIKGRKAPWGQWRGQLGFKGLRYTNDKASAYEHRSIDIGIGANYDSGWGWSLSQGYSYGGLSGFSEIGASQTRLGFDYEGKHSLRWRGLWNWGFDGWLQRDRFDDQVFAVGQARNRTQVGLRGRLGTEWVVREHHWTLAFDHAWLLSNGEDVLGYRALVSRLRVLHRGARSPYVVEFGFDHQQRFDQQRSSLDANEAWLELFVRVERPLWSKDVLGWLKIGLSDLKSEQGLDDGRSEGVLLGVTRQW